MGPLPSQSDSAAEPQLTSKLLCVHLLRNREENHLADDKALPRTHHEGYIQGAQSTPWLSSASCCSRACVHFPERHILCSHVGTASSTTP